MLLHISCTVIQFLACLWFGETQSLAYFVRRLLQFYVIYFTVQNNRQDYRTLYCLTAVLLWIAELLGVQNGQQLQQKVYLTENNL
jgi:hypothetical protein